MEQEKRKRVRTQLPAQDMIYGKVPPQAVDIEKAVLGAIMLEKNAFDEASDIVTAESFYTNAHQVIFKAMSDISNRSGKIDLLTVTEELIRNGKLDEIGGAYYLTGLTIGVVRANNIDEWCKKIQERYISREMINIGGVAVNGGYDETMDPFELIDLVDEKITSLSTGSIKSSFVQVGEEMAPMMMEISEKMNDKVELTGVPSGFKSVDRLTFGWQPTDLIILAARPAVGKTAFALNLARNAALDQINPKPVGFFSLEMSTKQLIERLLSSESEIDLESIKRGKLEEYQLQKLYNTAMIKLKDAPIFIDDTPAITLMELRSKARRLVRKHNAGLIIIDYLQLMSGDRKSGNREQEISTISRGLKGLAKELGIPIIALSQLSREVEKRNNSKMPQLSDLRESGAIEQDADMVMFLYRPEYYETNSNEFADSNKGETHLRIAKHRHGSLEAIKLRAMLNIQKFYDMESMEFKKIEAQAGDSVRGGNWKSVSNAFDTKNDDL